MNRHERLRQLMKVREVDAVVIRRPANFAWYTGGADTKVDRRGREERYSADVVVVSCGAINSSALLLRSASDQHPNGLANGSDVVGRNHMAHINSGVIAISQTPNTTKFQKTRGVND